MKYSIVYGDILNSTSSILVNPVSNKDGLFTKINRFREKKIMRKLRKKELFTKGKYYDE